MLAHRGALRHAERQAVAHAWPIARKYDKSYGHFHDADRTSSSTGRRCRTFRAILADLASVEMHAIQTSGNCIRNVTATTLPALRR